MSLRLQLEQKDTKINDLIVDQFMSETSQTIQHKKYMSENQSLELTPLSVSRGQ